MTAHSKRSAPVLFWMLLIATLAVSGPAAAASMLVGPPNDLVGSGTIAAPGATESWAFDANPAGGSFTITGTPDASLQLELEILNPSSVVIAAGTTATIGAVLQLLDIPLTEAGAWTIIVDGRAGTTGSYMLEVIGNADAHILGNVPEPATLALFGVALAGLGFSRRWVAS